MKRRKIYIEIIGIPYPNSNGLYSKDKTKQVVEDILRERVVSITSTVNIAVVDEEDL